MEFIQTGNQLFVEENYQQAVEHYTKALSKLMGKQQFAAFFGRARACMYLDKHYNAVRDFGECLSLDHTHQLTNYYLGICLMKIGKRDVEKLEQAHKYLLIAQKGASKQTRYEHAVGKCIKLLQKLKPKVEISSTEQKNDNQDADPSNTKETDVEMKSHENNQQKTESQTETSTSSETKSQTASTAAASAKQKTQPTKPRIRESWYQSATNIIFTLYQKQLTGKDVSIRFEPQLVNIELCLKDGNKYTRHLELRGEIEPAKSSYSVNPYKVILTLSKRTVGDWESLESELEDGKQRSMIQAPWTTKKDWSEVDKFASEELEKEKPEGDEALQSLFSKIYKDADDDQRRAMVKSFQTSGGTVLSTNWNDVKSKDYEGKDKVLPTGQSVEKW
eukprot:CAMPEP_0197021214 /NCGR_PEP_ID=MMETSP1384-20130603/2114_1 /TAXON_ID=29189 /ORGANISM="Ammonia sp." /LENGTH=389 /DNA_ID=CAMNT_0042448993 /DNA_START=58 /DNA_END=1224 /DNA_ORIENTATION=+